jgi:hypothetical protein
MLNTGCWNSSFIEMSVKFNENILSLVPAAYDQQDGTLFGVIDVTEENIHVPPIIM